MERFFFRLRGAIISVLALVSMALPGAAATPPSGLGIAAVVNGEAITSYDVNARMRFIVVTTRLSDAPETLARIRPQVIRSLVDEKLQVKEAEKNGITITDNEVAAAIAAIEKQRGMPDGTILRMLAQNRVPKETFTSQIRAQLAWNRLLISKIRPTVKISEEEIALAQKRIAIPAVKQELEIAVLTLPVDKPKREGEVRSLAEKLVGEVKAGASFEEVSRQFASNVASAGGKVNTFWVRPEQLDPAIGRALAAARAGTITNPVRTADGFTIVKVYNTRALPGQKDANEPTVELKDIALTLKSGADNTEAGALLSIGEAIAKNPGSCEEKTVAGIADIKDVDIAVTRRSARLSELTPAVRAIVDGLKVGAISAPFATDAGIQLYMLCGRGEAPPAALDTDRVRNVIYQQKMELEAQRYLRNLRRDAYVEVR